MTSYTAMEMPAPGVPPRPVTRPLPEPREGEALVRVRASSLNYHDTVTLLGLIDGPWPRVPMSDGAGEVVALGPGCARVEVGARVMGAFYPDWVDGPPTGTNKRAVPGDTRDGWLQQFQLFPANALVPAPAHLSDAEVATLPCAATTAYSALAAAAIGPGGVVVTLGTGGVSLFVVQFAKALGARVVVTSSSDDKLAAAAKAGADHGLNYRAVPAWGSAVRDLTGGRGADLVVELGGPGTLNESIRAAAVGATVAIVGFLSGAQPPPLPMTRVMAKNLRLVGVTVGSVADLRAVGATVARTGLRPVLSEVLDWERTAEATRILHAGEHVGKIALSIP